MSPPRPSWATARQSALIAGLASALGCAAFFAAAPGSWFARIETLAIVQRPWGEAIVLEQRRIWPGDGLLVQWSNAIHQPDHDGSETVPGKVICSAEGSWSISDESATTAEIALRDWLGGKWCPVHTPGGVFIAVAEWRFRVLGLEKSSVAVSHPQIVHPLLHP